MTSSHRPNTARGILSAAAGVSYRSAGPIAPGNENDVSQNTRPSHKCPLAQRYQGRTIKNVDAVR